MGRAVGYDGDLLQRVDQQTGRDGEAGPQNHYRILERRLHADGAARRVDRGVDDGRSEFVESVRNPSELRAVAGVTPAASALLICGTSSSGAVNATEIRFN